MSVEIPYFHPSRKVQWGGSNGEADLFIYGLDWNAATFLMTFAYNQGESPAITLTNAAAGSQGLSAIYDATLIHPTTGAVVGGTRIRPQINSATLLGLNWTVIATKVMHYDLKITPAGISEIPYSYGTFKIRVGTQ